MNSESRQSLDVTRLLKALFHSAKLRLVFLLTFAGAATMLIAGQFTVPPVTFISAIMAISLTSAGANVLTGYIDRDIDAIMTRTQHRPLPKQHLTPRTALAFGLLLASVGMILSWTLGLLFFLIGLAGLLDYVMVYSYFYKRRTWASVLFGSFSGGAPVLGGWVAATQTLSIESVILAAIVILWIPGHIWNLALSYADDYRAAEIPMLPAVAELPLVTRSIALSIFLLAGLSFVPVISGFAGIWYVAISLPVTTVVVAGNLWLAISPSKRMSWTMFKISSPYLFILFLALIVDVLV